MTKPNAFVGRLPIKWEMIHLTVVESENKKKDHQFMQVLHGTVAKTYHKHSYVSMKDTLYTIKLRYTSYSNFSDHYCSQNANTKQNFLLILVI